MQNKVNCFLVGAQKSGSTALAGYLTQHEDIFLPPIKAPNFFNKKYKKSFQIESIEKYHKLFNWDKKYQIDSSDCYHSDFDALKAIHEYNSQAKILILLRDPEKMLVSLHSHLLWAGYEDIQDINQAFKEQVNRARNLNIPSSTPDKSFLEYSSMCNIGDQVKYIIELFGRKNVYCVSSKGLQAEPQNTLNSIFEWLDLDSMQIALDKTKKNKAVQPRSQFVSKINNKIPAKFKTNIKLAASKIGLDFDGLMRTINGKKMSSIPQPLLDADLKEFCLKQKQLVYKLTGIEL